MFAERLSTLLGKLLPRQRYITVTAPAAASERMLPPTRMPRHVALIMDGNGRWAQRRGLPRTAGHAHAMETLRDLIRASDDWGVEVLSLYAFSTENWNRSQEEVGALMGLLLKYFKSEIDELHAKKVCIRILGDVDGLPEPQRKAVIAAMERTKENTGLKLNIALNYGGHQELTHAARLLAQRVKEGSLEPDAITPEMLEDALYTSGLPAVDLLIRTSGEIRTSNFLPWQTAYAEMIFDSTLFPDYDRLHYLKSLREYAARDRRYGGIKAADTEVGK